MKKLLLISLSAIIFSCTTEVKEELNAVYYYDGNNTIKHVTSVDDIRKITNKPDINADQVGAMVIHNCTGVHYGGSWQG